METVIITGIQHYLEFHIPSIAMRKDCLAAVPQDEVISVFFRNLQGRFSLERISIVGIQVGMNSKLCIANLLRLFLCELISIAFLLQRERPNLIRDGNKLHLVQRVFLIVGGDEFELKVETQGSRF